MIVQHSASSMVHRLATADASVPGNALALVARARGEILQAVALEKGSAPDGELRATQTLIDKTA